MTNSPWLAESPSLVVLGMEKLLGELKKSRSDDEGRGKDIRAYSS